MKTIRKKKFSSFLDKKELNIMVRLCLSIQDIMKIHEYYLICEKENGHLSEKLYLIKITVGHLLEAHTVVKQLFDYSKNNPSCDTKQLLDSLNKVDKENIQKYKSRMKILRSNMEKIRNNLTFHYR